MTATPFRVAIIVVGDVVTLSPYADGAFTAATELHNELTRNP